MESGIHRGLTVLTIDDIRRAYDNVSIEIVMELHRRHITDPQILWLCETVLRGHEGPERTIGIDQGSAYSPIALNLLLHYALDIRLQSGAADHLWLRYADNLAFLTQSVRQGREALRQASQLLQTVGLTLKGQDGAPANLLQGGWKQLLGFRISLRGNQIHYGLDAKEWKGLAEALDYAHTSENPPMMAQRVIQGWIEGYGPALDCGEVEATIGSVLGHAAMAGFRECSRDDVQRWALTARDGWRAYRHAHLGHARDQQAGIVAPPAATWTTPGIIA
jgi:hypothetical protein